MKTNDFKLEKIECVDFLMIDVDWIKENVYFIPENRSHYLDEKDASKHLFTKFDTIRLEKRLKFYLNNIFKVKPVWKVCCPMKVYCVDGKFYLADGQGRYLTVDLYNQSAKEKITKIPVMIIKGKTYTEMIEDMIDMNRFDKNWSTSDIFRCHCVMSGDTSLYENMIKVQNELKVKEYTAKLILFGYSKSSHRDVVKDNNYSEYKDIMFKSFKNFYDGTVIACNGNQNQINTIKKQDCAQALYKILSNIIVTCVKNNISYDKRIEKCLKILINFVNGLDRQFSFKQTLGGKQNAIGASFAKQIIKKTKDEYIIEAMRKAA